ncbi:hypothetical protein, partial [Deinococcus pimensis]|uniref:hypothetical protein n=1 Tax=Deinococcus pimensis TaxID=309888 RepID=UPI00146FAD1E
LGERAPEVSLVERLRGYLHDKRRAGLVVAVDDPDCLDPASHAWVQEALLSGGLPVVGLVTLADDTTWRHGADEPERRIPLLPL